MAGRVSRRQQISDRNNNVVNEKKTVKIIFRAGLYKRLSLLDGGHGKESESLENQEFLIRDYLAEHPEIELVDIYTDNGETGTDFERSDFNRMMDDIKHKKINCVIVKDLSRFGRSYLEAEEYIEKIFPFLGIRFIAVLDNVDTFSPECKVDDIMRSMKNLMNEAYSRDLSSKIGSAFDTKRAKGEMLYRTIPYGYEKSGDPMHPYRIDKAVAPNIIMFFEMYANGYDTGQIAGYCNDIGLLTPKEYRATKGLGGKRTNKYGVWGRTMISQILRNPVYLGHMEQVKSYKRFCNNQPQTFYPKEQWKLYENVNEPIVSQELWESVQSKFPKQNRSAPIDCPERHKESLVADLFYCKHCGKPLSRRWRCRDRYYSYLCRSHAVCGNAGCINSRTIMECDVEDAVTTQIKTQLELLGRCIRTLQPYGKSGEIKEIAELDTRIKTLETELNHKKVSLIPLFEDLCTGKINEFQYSHIKEKTEIDIAKKTLELTHLIQEKERLSKLYPTNDFIKRVLQYNPETEISKELIKTLVERIEYDSEKTITVKMKYQDIFQDLISRMESLEVEICTA